MNFYQKDIEQCRRNPPYGSISTTWSCRTTQTIVRTRSRKGPLWKHITFDSAHILMVKSSVLFYLTETKTTSTHYKFFFEQLMVIISSPRRLWCGLCCIGVLIHDPVTSKSPALTWSIILIIWTSRHLHISQVGLKRSVRIDMTTRCKSWHWSRPAASSHAAINISKRRYPRA